MRRGRRRRRRRQLGLGRAARAAVESAGCAAGRRARQGADAPAGGGHGALAAGDRLRPRHARPGGIADRRPGRRRSQLGDPMLDHRGDVARSRLRQVRVAARDMTARQLAYAWPDRSPGRGRGRSAGMPAPGRRPTSGMVRAGTPRAGHRLDRTMDRGIHDEDGVEARRPVDSHGIDCDVRASRRPRPRAQPCRLAARPPRAMRPEAAGSPGRIPSGRFSPADAARRCLTPPRSA